MSTDDGPGRAKPRALLLLCIGGLAPASVAAGTALHVGNELVAGSEEVIAARAQIEAVLQRRADLIPRVRAVAEAHADHERALFLALADALAPGPSIAAAPASSGGDLGEVGERERTVAAARAAIEAHPRLGASAAWATLRQEVVGSENRIAIERRRYNRAVRLQRTRLRTYPGRLVAPLFGFTLPEY